MAMGRTLSFCEQVGRRVAGTPQATPAKSLQSNHHPILWHYPVGCGHNRSLYNFMVPTPFSSLKSLKSWFKQESLPSPSQSAQEYPHQSHESTKSSAPAQMSGIARGRPRGGSRSGGLQLNDDKIDDEVSITV
jgi:hypothetical protein